MRFASLAVLVLASAACAPAEPNARDPVAPSTSASAAPDAIVSPPFDAAALRDGLRVGTEIRLRIGGEGQPTVIERWTVTAADRDGCTIHTETFAEDGATLLSDDGSATSKWSELEAHAHFPAARTSRSDSSVDVPAGHFETWFFEVRPEKPGEPLKQFHFAKAFPGPPVWMRVTLGDKVLASMDLVSRK
jgi:hypothetical protein